jgi:hypothetical protein
VELKGVQDMVLAAVKQNGNVLKNASAALNG